MYADEASVSFAAQMSHCSASNENRADLNLRDKIAREAGCIPERNRGMRSCHCTQLRYESIRACAAAGKTNVPLALQQKESGTPVKVWTMISRGIAAANAAAPPVGSKGRCQIPHRADTKIAESQAEPPRCCPSVGG
jgi:hypothetical protein